MSRPAFPRGTVTDFETGKVLPPEPLLASDGKPLQEEYELVLKATVTRDPKVARFHEKPVEEGEYAIRYTSPAGEQRGFGQYRYGKYGFDTLVLEFENGQDDILVSKLDAIT